MTSDREERIARVLAQYDGPEHAGLRMLIVELASDAGEVGRRDALIATLTSRLSQIEEALGGAQRAGKRQAAPFSKKWPKASPKTSGRKSRGGLRTQGAPGSSQPCPRPGAGGPIARRLP